MSYIFHIPRKKEQSSEPRIKISVRIISINPACIEKYFKDKQYAKVGYDVDNKKMIFVPVAKQNGGLKIVKNAKWDSHYLNASKLINKLSFKDEVQGEYKCLWDDSNKGIVIDIKKDKVK
ncbi:MAG: hypothetical protein P9L96_03265 [Candidatus Gygaella obscura]|nr:hypothetical protein [Candidatus Gygaella obscura]